MKVEQLKTIIAEHAKTEGFYGFAFEKIDRDNKWIELAETMQLYGVQDGEDVEEYLTEMDYFRHCAVLDPLPCLTRFEWRSNGRSFSEFAKPFSTISARLYWYFLEILPPLYKPFGFMVSEPYSYCTKHNQSTYAAFCKVNGKHYALGDIAPNEYETALNHVNTLN